MAHWFKFYGSDYLTDPKMMSLKPTEKALWITLLCLASNTEDGVIRYLTEERLKLLTGLSQNDTEWNSNSGILEKFQSLKMIRIEQDEIHVINFQKRQESFLTEAERSARYRAKKKSSDGNHGGSVTNDTLEQNREEQNRKEYITTTFAKFWASYPRKESKKKAEQIWLTKIKPDEKLFGFIMAGLERSKKSSQWLKDNGQFIPHPTTWLNQERWADEGVEKGFTTNVKSEKFMKVESKVL